MRLSIAIAVYYLSWMLSYALDGNPQDKEEPNYLYQLLAPIDMAMLCPVVMCAEYYARRIAKGLRSRNEIQVAGG